MDAAWQAEPDAQASLHNPHPENSVLVRRSDLFLGHAFRERNSTREAAVAELAVAAALCCQRQALAVFVAGLAYNRGVGKGERGPQESVDEAVNRYAVLPLFFVLGAVLPWREWVAFGPGAVAFLAAVLLLRRLPLVVALARPLALPRRDGIFAGWFGPMGVSAIFYLAHSLEKGVSDPRLFAAGSLAVAASVLAFGVSATPGRNAYSRS